MNAPAGADTEDTSPILAQLRQTSPDQPYAVVKSPPGPDQLQGYRTVAPAYGPSYQQSAAYTWKQFFSKPVNIVALGLGIAGAIALVILFVFYLSIRRRQLARHCAQLETGASNSSYAQKQVPIVDSKNRVLVTHPDDHICCGFQTPCSSPNTSGSAFLAGSGRDSPAGFSLGHATQQLRCQRE